MLETRHLGFSIASVRIADRDFYNLQIELRSAKDQVEVDEWIEVTEVSAIRDNLIVVSRRKTLVPHRVSVRRWFSNRENTEAKLRFAREFKNRIAPSSNG